MTPRVFAHDNLEQLIQLKESSPSTGPTGKYFKAEWKVAGIASQELTGEYQTAAEPIYATDLAERTGLDTLKPYKGRLIGWWSGRRVFAFRSDGAGGSGGAAYVDTDVSGISDVQMGTTYILFSSTDYSISAVAYICIPGYFCGWYYPCECTWVPWYCYQGVCRQYIHPPEGAYGPFYDPYACYSYCKTGTGTGTGTATPEMWYCLISTGGQRVCLDLTEAELSDLLIAGYQLVDGPFATSDICYGACFSEAMPPCGAVPTSGVFFSISDATGWWEGMYGGPMDFSGGAWSATAESCDTVSFTMMCSGSVPQLDVGPSDHNAELIGWTDNSYTFHVTYSGPDPAGCLTGVTEEMDVTVSW